MTGYPTLAELRERLQVTQTEMATKMGMPLRSYQDIENGRNPVRPVHLQAARFALLMFCADGKILFDDLPWDVVETVNAAIAPSRTNPKFREWLNSRPK